MNLVNILNNGTNFIRKKVLPYALAVGMGLGGISCGKEKSTSPDYDVPENLKLLQTEQVVSFENETLIFSKPTEQTRSLKQGDIIGCGITSETPHGLLRRITSISKDKKIIKTESVTLADVAKDYHIEFDKELTSEDIVSVKLRKGVLESKRNELLGYNLNLKIDNVVLYDLDKNENTTFDQIVANGNIGFNSHLYITCKAEDWELKHFDFKNIINEKVQLKLNSNTNSGIINKEVQIAKYSFPPMTVGAIPTPIGPIPIIITPKISINVGINGNTPTLKTDVTQDAEVTAGVSYKNGQWNDLSNLKNIFEFKKPEIYGDTNIKFYAGPQLNLMVYDFAGPYAELNAHLRFEVDMSQENLWELYGGLEAKLGAEIEIFSHKLADYESTVINKEKLLTKGGINFEIPEDDDFIDDNPIQGKIAFTSDRDGNMEIYVMNADGSNPKNLTNHPDWDSSPSWSPDGSKIAFSSYRDRTSEIYVMNIDGSNQKKLTDKNRSSDRIESYSDLSWSPDGSKIAYSKFIFDRINQKVYYVISIRNIDNLHEIGLRMGSNPSWSPDGSKIVFDSNRDGSRAIYVMNSDGSDVRRITYNGFYYSPSWSPDGSKIALSSNTDGNGEIYVMNADGSNPKNLTNNPASDSEPDWSPDGSKIAFVSDRDGNNEIYVMNADGSNPRNLTNHPANDTEPDWSPK